MNIALLLTGFDIRIREATKVTVLLLAKELKNQGHNVVIISDKRKHLVSEEVVEGIKVYRLYGKSKNTEPNKILNYFTAFPKSIKYLEKRGLKFDVIHNFSSSPLLVLRGLLAKKASKKAKLVHSIKSTPKKTKWDVLTRILNFSDTITVQSNITKRKLIREGVKKNKIKIINSHIDTEYFKKAKTKKEKMVLYYGPLVDRKGVKYLLKSIPRVAKETKVKFYFVIKPTKIKQHYKELLKNPEISKHLNLIVRQANIPEYINKSEIVVLPYPNLQATESNPSCILESMSCGTAVISSDLPELNEIFEKDKEIILTKPKDVNDLTEKIIELLNNKKLREKIASNGYEKSKQFDVKLITKKYLELYDSL